MCSCPPHMGWWTNSFTSFSKAILDSMRKDISKKIASIGTETSSCIAGIALWPKSRERTTVLEFIGQIGDRPRFFFGRKLVRLDFLTWMTQWNRGKSFSRKWSVENHLLEQIAWRKRSSSVGLYLISGSTPSAFFPQPNGALRTSCFAITYRRRGSKPVVKYWLYVV